MTIKISDLVIWNKIILPVIIWLHGIGSRMHMAEGDRLDHKVWGSIRTAYIYISIIG